MEAIFRIDDRGGLFIPSEIREAVGLRDYVRLPVEGDRTVLEPHYNPIEALTSPVLEKEVDIEKDIRTLKKAVLTTLKKAK